MLKLKSCLFLSVVSSLCYAHLPTEGIFPVPPKPIYIPLIGPITYDILVEVIPSANNPLNAFGSDSGPQGILRNTNTIDASGNPILYPPNSLLARGMQFLVAGFIYPEGSLKHCKNEQTEPCV